VVGAIIILAFIVAIGYNAYAHEFQLMLLWCSCAMNYLALGYIARELVQKNNNNR
jgi:hypothetical protein